MTAQRRREVPDPGARPNPAGPAHQEGRRRGDFADTIVLVNRYDGIDLPDETCRVLIFDSRPYSESLIDLHAQQVRSRSEATLMRTVRTVEQGMGRSVRGEKDYWVILNVNRRAKRALTHF